MIQDASAIGSEFTETQIIYQEVDTGWLIGDSLTYPDLSMFQIIEGLRYVFPKVFKRAEVSYPKMLALHKAVAARPNTAAYLASERRIDFNTMGVFRHYPELDG